MKNVTRVFLMLAVVASLGFASCKKCKECKAYNAATMQYDGGIQEKCGDELKDAESEKIPATEIKAWDCDF
ncbi:MAG: hypothetical protein M0D57_12865 [Sphingobacteriales bacterium JAD_PAG50586_3]|nr:MAG: hypothetical protein M0D57_12865 [Sphingobacteriales bacterium JAD_PAG50586_3]